MAVICIIIISHATYVIYVILYTYVVIEGRVFLWWQASFL